MTCALNRCTRSTRARAPRIATRAPGVGQPAARKRRRAAKLFFASDRSGRSEIWRTNRSCDWWPGLRAPRTLPGSLIRQLGLPMVLDAGHSSASTCEPGAGTPTAAPGVSRATPARSEGPPPKHRCSKWLRPSWSPSPSTEPSGIEQRSLQSQRGPRRNAGHASSNGRWGLTV